jgi:hypothetical protein
MANVVFGGSSASQLWTKAALQHNLQGDQDGWFAVIPPSLVPGDFHEDGKIDSRDFCALAQHWRQEEPLLDIMPPPFGDGLADFQELAVLSQNWLMAIPGQALNPNPPDGVPDTPVIVDLTWTPGTYAASHDVYFGTTDPPPFMHNQISTTFDPGSLADITTYFWRIDEVNPSATTTGEVWSFTTGDKGRFCFPADALVWAEGTPTKISELLPGQKLGKSVLRCSQFAEVQVESIDEHEGTFGYYDIVLESGNRISVVGSHLLLLDSGQWTHAEHLRPGLKLKSAKGSVSIINIATRSYIGKVYNLKIKGSDRYSVGKDGITVRDY